ncbi:nucleotidyltransferase, partial [Acinetobacter baumannii]
FSIKNDFLTGSSGRHTKTRPLKDVDIFFVLDKEKEKKYMNDPLLVLSDFKNCLAKKYGESKVSIGRRSVGIDIALGTTDEDKV